MPIGKFSRQLLDVFCEADQIGVVDKLEALVYSDDEDNEIEVESLMQEIAQQLVRLLKFGYGATGQQYVGFLNREGEWLAKIPIPEE
jgi:hypothetical protein